MFRRRGGEEIGFFITVAVGRVHESRSRRTLHATGVGPPYLGLDWRGTGTHHAGVRSQRSPSRTFSCSNASSMLSLVVPLMDHSQHRLNLLCVYFVEIQQILVSPSSKVPATVDPRVGNWLLTNSQLVSSSIISKNTPYPVSLSHLYSGYGEDTGEFWMVPGPRVPRSPCVSGGGYDTVTTERRTPHNGRHCGWQSTANLICCAHGERSNSDLGMRRCTIIVSWLMTPSKEGIESTTITQHLVQAEGCVGPSLDPPTHASLR